MKTIQENKPLRALEALKALRVVMTLVVLMTLTPLQAQVTIGDETAPQPFSLLEISTENEQGGLRLPQLTTEQRNALNIAYADQTKAKGLQIFNIDTNCVETWNGTTWIKQCVDQVHCPVKISDTEWITLRCYNLGADESVPWQIPSEQLIGKYYLWGRTAPYATAWKMLRELPGAPLPASVSSWTEVEPDPCTRELGAPWRLPTSQEWEAIVKSNQWREAKEYDWVHDGRGTLFNNGIYIYDGSYWNIKAYIPFCGYRTFDSGWVNGLSSWTRYWSSMAFGSGRQQYANINVSGVVDDRDDFYIWDESSLTSAYSIRCVLGE